MISVLVVDDSAVIRRLITDALATDRKIQVAGTASDGRIALEKIEQLRPDIVTLDLEMPVMGGLDTLRALRPRHPRLPIIVFSTLSAAGATATLDALAAGATDYVTKPANVGSIRESIRSVREQLIPRIHALCASRSRTEARQIMRGPIAPSRPPTPFGTSPRPPERQTPPAAARPPRRDLVPYTQQRPRPERPGAGAAAQQSQQSQQAPQPQQPQSAGRARTERADVVAIGCSTGGPDALSKVLRALPGKLPVPVVVVQHMPPVFTKMFAERLDRTCGLSVVEASDGTPVLPGTVYIAPGDLHLEVVRKGSEVLTKLQTGPPENFCRPSVDVLFRSVTQAYSGNAIAVVLTGMGQDGRRGAEKLRAAGAEIVAQDELTSVVWGMPGAVTNAGLADLVLPLDEVANHLISRITGGRRTPSMEVIR